MNRTSTNQIRKFTQNDEFGHIFEEVLYPNVFNFSVELTYFLNLCKNNIICLVWD